LDSYSDVAQRSAQDAYIVKVVGSSPTFTTNLYS
jgi:hypothetical protein